MVHQQKVGGGCKQDKNKGYTISGYYKVLRAAIVIIPLEEHKDFFYSCFLYLDCIFGKNLDNL